MNCTNQCPLKKCLLPMLSVFFFMMGFETFFDGYVMAGLYKRTAAVWRPDVQMQALWYWSLLHIIALAAIITCLWYRFSDKEMGNCSMGGAGGKPECPHSKGICFGLKIGLFMALMHSREYAWFPIPVTMAIAWFIGGVVEGLGIGLILSAVTKKQEETPKS